MQMRTSPAKQTTIKAQFQAASSSEIASSGDRFQKELPTPPVVKTKSMAQIQVVSSSEVGNNTARVQEDQVVLSAINRNSHRHKFERSGFRKRGDRP